MTNTSAVGEAGPAQAVSPEGCFLTNPAFHFETLRNPEYIMTNCADLGEVLNAVKVIDEGDSQSRYAVWKATADLALALAERTRDSASKSGPECAFSLTSRRLSF